MGPAFELAVGTVTAKHAHGRPVAVDLFCGVGGMSEGFRRAGFRLAFAVDHDERCTRSFRRNHRDVKVMTADISDLTGAKLRSAAGLGNSVIDVLFGGPPCQGFSIGGKRLLDDPRNALLTEFGRLVRELRPRYVVIENVRGLLRAGGRLVAPLIEGLSEAGYCVLQPIPNLNAADFGVPQRRNRVFIFAWAASETPVAPPQSSLEHAPTVWSALSDLPSPEEVHDERGVFRGKLPRPSSYAGKLRRRGSSSRRMTLTGFLRTEHSDDVITRFRQLHPGERDDVSRFFRLDPHGIAPTLRAGTGPDYGRFTAPRPIHPFQPRCITVREAARLHSFPDRFTFDDTRWHAYRMIGNSVPPLLAEAVARQVFHALSTSREVGV